MSTTVKKTVLYINRKFQFITEIQKSSSIQYTKNIRADRNDTLVPTHDVNICIILTEHFISEYNFSNLIPLFNL
jgi:hypothetical protein